MREILIVKEKCGPHIAVLPNFGYWNSHKSTRYIEHKLHFFCIVQILNCIKNKTLTKMCKINYITVCFTEQSHAEPIWTKNTIIWNAIGDTLGQSIIRILDHLTAVTCRSQKTNMSYRSTSIFFQKYSKLTQNSHQFFK